MLELRNIIKTYNVAGKEFPALNNVSLNFRKNEFVSILGPSGSGKTTLLNIIGGLDRYTSGDLLINNISTKKYSDKDWDTYRNHSIGFVFQSYNLINHQTILSNVELALTLSGINKKERRERAINMLEKVGLKDHIYKKPNQLSGGQMQRVAIARALINDPEILLADEPTGALDTATSEVIMDLLKDIAKDRLVIMVTHNPELAQEYSTRIISLRDGIIQDDTNPYKIEEKENFEKKLSGRTSMSFFTALGLSFNNLLTKKARTILTAFAGSIGIIGIALIISLSTGAQDYIEKIQEDTLTTYPISIQDEDFDITSLIEPDTNNSPDIEYSEQKISSTPALKKILESNQAFSETTKNNLTKFKKHIEDNNDKLNKITNSIDYGYNINLNLYKKIDDEIIKLNPFLYISQSDQSYSETQDFNQVFQGPIFSNSIFEELMGNKELLESQYDIVKGKWPEKKEELVLFVNSENQISDLTMYQLGIKNPEEISSFIKQVSNNENIDVEQIAIDLDDLIGLEYKYIPNTLFYEKKDGLWIKSDNENEIIENNFDKSLTLKRVGIVKVNPEANIEAKTGKLGYTPMLTNFIVETVNDSQIVKEQLENEKVDIFTNKEFVPKGEEIKTPKIEDLDYRDQQYILSLPQQQREIALMEFSEYSSSSFTNNLKLLGSVDFDSPQTINIYPKDYKSKEKIDIFIEDYNESNSEDNRIIYNDLVGLMISSVSSILSVITYLLIGFVSISLIVSSIMIGIITYVSVLERTKEIGILKSIGASKRDISRVFNAETIIIGLFSGGMGILITYLLLIPANSILYSLTGISNFTNLPINTIIILIGLSTLLTLLAGLIPARIAAKKDAVVALKSE